jgi:hypothetical protein
MLLRPIDQALQKRGGLRLEIRERFRFRTHPTTCFFPLSSKAKPCLTWPKAYYVNRWVRVPL